LPRSKLQKKKREAFYLVITNNILQCCTQYYNSFDDTSGQKVNCPSCFRQFSVDFFQPALEIEQAEGGNSNYSKSSIVNRIDMDKWRSSTKIEALYEELSKLRREDKTIKR
jgi:DNA repair protein RAD16